MKDLRAVAVDLGASGGKILAGVFRNQKLVDLREVYRFSHDPTTLFVSDRRGRRTEKLHWDVLQIYSNVLRGLRLAVSDLPSQGIHAPEVSIGIDAWGADGQFLSADGEFLGEMYAYRDHRLDGMIETVNSFISAERLYRLTGIHMQPFNISNQLLWFRLHRSSLFHLAHSFLPVASLFYFLLGGGSLRIVDSTIGSVSQLMDVNRLQWSPEIFRKLRIPMRLMPSIVFPATKQGVLSPEVCRSIGFLPDESHFSSSSSPSSSSSASSSSSHRPTLVAVAMHDTASAFAAAPCGGGSEVSRESALIISSGTWSLVGRLVGSPQTTSDLPRRYNFSNEGGIGNVRLLKNVMGMWILQKLRAEWAARDGFEMSWKQIETEAAASPHSLLSFVDPDDSSFYHPPKMEIALMNYFAKTNQKLPTSKGGLIRSVLESLALKYRVVSDQLEEILKSPSKGVYIVGGGSRNSLLNQLTADATQLRVTAGPEEATAIGNLMLQAVGMNAVPSLDAAAAAVRGSLSLKTFDPLPRSAGKWKEAAHRFRRIVSEKIPLKKE